MKPDRETEVLGYARAARQASRKLASLPEATRNLALSQILERIRSNSEALLQANQHDLHVAQEAVDRGEMTRTVHARLVLDETKLAAILQGLADIIKLPDPIQQMTWGMQLDEGLTLHRVSCPLGVLGVIFEARPDVIPQILGLAVKSGNAALLKGGQEAKETNAVFFRLVTEALRHTPGFPEGAYHLLESREDVKHLLGMQGLIDLIIPRGGNALVTYIQENTRIPVMGHADGICHLYVDQSADLGKARRIILDAKTQYPSACNAVETVLVHAGHIGWLPLLARELREKGVELFGDAAVCQAVPGVSPVTREADWHREFGDLKIALKVVGSVDEAIDHINTFGSGHTEGIITENLEHRDRFMMLVDAAGVYHNASTRFADGFRYGLGAEVGISTQKTHARGPVGLEGLTIYKYRLFGAGHIVGDYVGKEARPFQHRLLTGKPGISDADR